MKRKYEQINKLRPRANSQEITEYLNKQVVFVKQFTEVQEFSAVHKEPDWNAVIFKLKEENAELVRKIKVLETSFSNLQNENSNLQMSFSDLKDHFERESKKFSAEIRLKNKPSIDCLKSLAFLMLEM